MKSVVRWSRALAFGLMALSACGCHAQREAATVVGSLTGILFVTGNEPFTDISLQTVDGRMHTIQKDTTALYSTLRSRCGYRPQGRPG